MYFGQPLVPNFQMLNLKYLGTWAVMANATCATWLGQKLVLHPVAPNGWCKIGWEGYRKAYMCIMCQGLNSQESFPYDRGFPIRGGITIPNIRSLKFRPRHISTPYSRIQDFQITKLYFLEHWEFFRGFHQQGI